MSKGFFITGTDTEIGKTLITTSLMRVSVNQGAKVAGMKPIASGCEKTDQGLRNDDAIKIMSEASVDFDYETINPYAFEPSVSPHFAAEQSDEVIEFKKIIKNYKIINHQSEQVFVEGVGGWEVPLGKELRISDLAKEMNLPIILVIGLRLGCINHALLTIKSIRDKGLRLVACIATQIDPDYKFCEETITTLEQQIDIPVQYVPWFEKVRPELITQYLESTVEQINENI